MSSRFPDEHGLEEVQVTRKSISEDVRPLSPLPFAVQLSSIFPAEIIVRRFPLEAIAVPFADLRITGIIVDTEKLRGQAILELEIDYPKGERPCEISFKIVGLFHYDPQFSKEKVRKFLKEGSMSVLLPYARELLLSLCGRLQIPPIILPLAQVGSGDVRTQDMDINND